MPEIASLRFEFYRGSYTQKKKTNYVLPNIFKSIFRYSPQFRLWFSLVGCKDLLSEAVPPINLQMMTSKVLKHTANYHLVKSDCLQKRGCKCHCLQPKFNLLLSKPSLLLPSCHAINSIWRRSCHCHFYYHLLQLLPSRFSEVCYFSQQIWPSSVVERVHLIHQKI